MGGSIAAIGQRLNNHDEAIQDLRNQVAWLTSRVEDIPPGQAIRDTMDDVRTPNHDQARADAYAEIATMISYETNPTGRLRWYRGADGTLFVGIEDLLAELRERAGQDGRLTTTHRVRTRP
jgi:hypothetical protein